MINSVIMAGGKGERFWPKSRERTPKQLLAVTGEKNNDRRNSGKGFYFY